MGSPMLVTQCVMPRIHAPAAVELAQQLGPGRLTRRATYALLLSLGARATAGAQAPPVRVPMGTGATIVQTLSAAGGDRESVHRVRLASDLGLHYEWLLEEVHAAGDTVRQDFRYLEAWSDIADAKRLRAFHDSQAPEAHPGYTMHALSRAIYRRLREGRSDSLQIMYVDQLPGSELLSSFGFGGPRMTPVRWRGTIAPATPGTVPFPVLLNGRRVRLPALHLRADLTARQGRWQPQLWILADSSYPLILKWVGGFRETANVLQTTRIDLPLAKVVVEGTVEGDGDGVLLTNGDGLLLAEAAPVGVAPGGSDQSSAGLERALAASCRVELPGIYFAFNSAQLQPASDRAIAELAAILERHPDWTATLEGHTDSIGTAAANKALSERRVASVRARLVDQHKVSAARLRVAGFGAARPREPNGTIEGRARNRRVELVRECAAAE
jgi:outer membrane protein OmpA-like peptidoglycan-associated protein